MADWVGYYSYTVGRSFSPTKETTYFFTYAKPVFPKLAS